jgi:hypothetical protein
MPAKKADTAESKRKWDDGVNSGNNNSKNQSEGNQAGGKLNPSH